MNKCNVDRQREQRHRRMTCLTTIAFTHRLHRYIHLCHKIPSLNTKRIKTEKYFHNIVICLIVILYSSMVILLSAIVLLLLFFIIENVFLLQTLAGSQMFFFYWIYAILLSYYLKTPLCLNISLTISSSDKVNETLSIKFI